MVRPESLKPRNFSASHPTTADQARSLGSANRTTAVYQQSQAQWRRVGAIPRENVRTRESAYRSPTPLRQATQRRARALQVPCNWQKQEALFRCKSSLNHGGVRHKADGRRRPFPAPGPLSKANVPDDGRARRGAIRSRVVCPERSPGEHHTLHPLQIPSETGAERVESTIEVFQFFKNGSCRRKNSVDSPDGPRRWADIPDLQR